MNTSTSNNITANRTTSAATSSSSINLTALNVASLSTLAIQEPNYICWLVLSTMSIVANSLVFITIFLTKALHNKSQFIIMCHSYAELFFMCAYFGTGMKRVLAYELSVPETSNQFVCMLKQFPLVFGGILVKCFALSLAMDRFLCLAFPIMYKTMSTFKYVAMINAIIWTYSLANIPFAFWFYSSEKMFSVCGFTTAFDPTYVSYNTTEANVFRVSTACVYFIASCILYRRYKKTNFSGENQKREWKRQMDFDVFLAVSMIGVIYLSSVGVSTLVTTIASSQSAVLGAVQVSIIFNPIISALTFFSSLSHLFVYLKLNGLFRKSFKQVCMRRFDNSVGPMG